MRQRGEKRRAPLPHCACYLFGQLAVIMARLYVFVYVQLQLFPRLAGPIASESNVRLVNAVHPFPLSLSLRPSLSLASAHAVVNATPIHFALHAIYAIIIFASSSMYYSKKPLFPSPSPFSLSPPKKKFSKRKVKKKEKEVIRRRIV